MGDETQKDALSRRGFLGVGSAALAAASVLSAEGVLAQQKAAPNSISEKSRSDPGPANSVLDGANPDSFNPVSTDAGGGQTFKDPFAFAHKRLQEGGGAREVAVR